MNSITLSSSAIQRFWRSINKGDCWEWIGAKNETGYGIFRYFKIHLKAHRLSWMVHFGKIPDSFSVLHKCDNRSCVNPEHLFLGSQKDNIQDMVSKKRNIFGEKHKLSKLTSKDVITIKGLLQNKVKCSVIAKSFPVSRRLIQKIKDGKAWKHIK